MPTNQPITEAAIETVTNLTTRTRAEREPEPAVEDLRIRNFDTETAHHVTLTMTNAEDVIAHENQYFLPPGTTIGRSPDLEPGQYTVTAAMDRERYATETCRVGPAPGETVIVEMGNGVISVTGTK